MVQRGKSFKPELQAGEAKPKCEGQLAELYLTQIQKLFISIFYFSLKFSEKGMGFYV